MATSRRSAWISMVAATVGVVLFTASPVAADTITKNGVRVSSPGLHLDWPSTSSIGGSSKCPSQDALDAFVYVRTSDDVVFVQDPCSDGRSAMARVITYNEAGNAVRYRVCRNSLGKGTWAKCDFDWPESASKICKPDPRECYNMVLVAGSYDADSGSTWWDSGNSYRFED